VRLDVDAIVTGGTPAAKALKNATRTVPLGMRIVAGLAKQLQAKISHRPGADGTEFVLTLPLQRGPHG